MISATAFRRARRSRAARELDRAETVRLVSLVALTAAVVATSLQLVTIALVSTDTSAWTLHLVVLDVACLLVVLIARLGFVRVAEVVLVAAIWAFFTDAAWTAGGTSAPAVAGQLVVVILAALLLGWRGSLVAGVAGVLTVFGLAVAQSIGRLPPSSVEQTAYSRALVLASCVVVVAVMATEMTRTLQQARRRLEGQLDQTSLLLDTAEGLASRTDLSHVLESICDSVLAATSHTRVGISLYDPRRREMTSAAARGEKPYAAGAVLPYASLPSSTRAALVAGRPHATRSTAMVPLVFAGNVVGMMTIDDPGERRQFLPREVALAESIGTQAAVAIEKARLFEAEHHIAETLQGSLLTFPATLPGLECARLYRAASANELVGGDFYDAFELGAGVVALTIGDVSGKGLDAAALTALVRNSLRSYAVGGLTPGQALLLTNEVVMKFTDDQTFVTLFFGCLDTRTGVLTYSEAGHPPPIVVAERTGFLPYGGSSLLGMFKGAKFDEEQFRLGPNDTLLLYTDGVTEARDKRRVLFGEERLRRAAEAARAQHPEALLRRVFAQAERFAGGELRDDIALVAVRLAAQDATSASGDAMAASPTAAAPSRRGVTWHATAPVSPHRK